MTTRRPSPLTVVALVVALLALLVAASTTSYAAGLARNSVGTKHLKAGAVTTAKLADGAVAGAKLKNGAVTGSKLAPNAVAGPQVRNGSLTAADLAPGTLAPRPVLVTRELDTVSGLTIATIAGVRFIATCQESNDIVQVVIAGTAGASDLEVAVTEARRTTSGNLSSSSHERATSSYVTAVQVPTTGNASLHVTGLVHVSGQSWLDVRLVATVADAGSPACLVRLVATPV